ncbi:hypothetical protein [Thermococcus henrietii]|uniref:hypothetical protein n=1 Tax=Thermococcus henrietii TaxID=2016361 RepID=UPI0011AB84BF|nr:hypothetical protein [Thermococcus henrietii]
MEMKKAVAGIILAVSLLAGLVYWEYYYVAPVPKPKIWGYTDPPSLVNMSWEKSGGVEVINATLKNASEVYGEVIGELSKIGYSMVSGNWSSIKCQWSYWSNRKKAYYIAYNGTRFLAIRGAPNAVLNASEEHWLCGKPLDASPLPSPSPWKLAESEALALGTKFMKNNITVSRTNWTGPLPDWYLAKLSFEAEIGDGVEVLILVYSSDTQVKYAEYLMKKKDRGLRFLVSDAGDYTVLMVLKGRKADVNRAVEIIQEPAT